MLVVGTVGLGVAAGVVVKNLSVPAAAPKAHISQGLGGAAQENPARRSGVQTVDANAASAVKAVGPDDRTSTTKLTPAYFQINTRLVVPANLQNLYVDTRGIIPAEAFAPAQLAPNSFLGPDAAERNAKLAAISAPNSFLGPDAEDRNAMLSAQPTKAVIANQRGHRWI